MNMRMPMGGMNAGSGGQRIADPANPLEIAQEISTLARMEVAMHESKDLMEEYEGIRKRIQEFRNSRNRDELMKIKSDASALISKVNTLSSRPAKQRLTTALHALKSQHHITERSGALVQGMYMSLIPVSLEHNRKHNPNQRKQQSRAGAPWRHEQGGVLKVRRESLPQKQFISKLQPPNSQTNPSSNAVFWKGMDLTSQAGAQTNCVSSQQVPGSRPGSILMSVPGGGDHDTLIQLSSSGSDSGSTAGGGVCAALMSCKLLAPQDSTNEEEGKDRKPDRMVEMPAPSGQLFEHLTKGMFDTGRTAKGSVADDSAAQGSSVGWPKPVWAARSVDQTQTMMKLLDVLRGELDVLVRDGAEAKMTADVRFGQLRGGLCVHAKLKDCTPGGRQELRVWCKTNYPHSAVSVEGPEAVVSKMGIRDNPPANVPEALLRWLQVVA